MLDSKTTNKLPKMGVPRYKPLKTDGYQRNHLAEIFGVDKATVGRMCANVTPVGIGPRNDSPLYTLRQFCDAYFQHELAKKFGHDPAKRNNPELMGPREQRDFYIAQKNKQAYELSVGELIEAEEVLHFARKALQHISQTMAMLPDMLEREVGLQPHQVAQMQEIVAKAQDEMAETWKDYCGDEIKREEREAAEAAIKAQEALADEEDEEDEIADMDFSDLDEETALAA